MTVRQLLSSIDSYELTAWLAYFEVEAEKQESEADRRRFERSITAGE